MKPVRTLLAAALALAAAPGFAQTYSQTVFFGDSLTDAGHFRPALVQFAGPSAAFLGKFTTNPGLVWSEYLAQFYGTNADPANQGGSNYAVGGARAGVNSTGGLGPIPSLATQVGSYLTRTGGRADANALYTVWGGNNDLLAVAGGAPAQATIGAAVTAQIGVVGTLQAAGARYVLVPTIPDLGLTPSARAQGAAAQAQFTQLAATYNAALFGGLATAGLRVIPLDTFRLLQEVVANPASFGFVNITGTACQPQITAQSLTCNPGTYVTPNAPTTYAFADGIHPTSATHEILADFAVSVLEAPRQIAVLPHVAASRGRARAERVAAQFDSRAAGDGARWWVDGRRDSQRYDDNDYEGDGPGVTVGVDWARGAVVFGGFAGYGRQRMDWGRLGGRFSQTDTTLGAVLGWQGEQAWMTGQASYSRLGHDIARKVQLGPATRVHRGSPDGDSLGLGVAAGWHWRHGGLRHGPVLSLLAQRIEIDGYAEDSSESTALAYPEQRFNSRIASVGWQASVGEEMRVRPYLRLTSDREFEDPAQEAFAQSRSMPGTRPYAVPGLVYDDRYVTALFGTRARLLGMEADVGVSTTLGHDGGSNTSLFASIGGRF